MLNKFKSSFCILSFQVLNHKWSSERFNNMNTHICSQALVFTRQQGDMNLSAHMLRVKFSVSSIQQTAELQLFSHKSQDGSWLFMNVELRTCSSYTVQLNTYKLCGGCLPTRMGLLGWVSRYLPTRMGLLGWVSRYRLSLSLTSGSWEMGVSRGQLATCLFRSVALVS